ncbi:acyl-CoA dehydrogenase [Helicobacter saguini]|uniref:Acyl-CoA dehydrogenase n=1 Tax=Helicobacter saguini TaxID=1548018 RepID=A0A347VMZ1_9HELI|nr:acyl-CoA dehydrogenase family protein [Helicobacter saguini]MWV61969.1 acyl-CoA dehydrogenase [Helicobacter saguini]MWV67356.1 acyl-CoA dehydrogenase [Helicobacter saguini]MWV69709.1 acyl-CoA dehydrogenase [Helicobacter saguini]MWV73074.1 acyl-CoA dehydrogenase [Helicobacter saguini]TLD95555.1 acyl-CoA dehydrogenase [Helicobacter saguini]
MPDSNLVLNLENLESVTHAFARKYIAPFTKEVDSKGEFPREAYDAMRRLKFLALFVPKEYGGLGGGMRDYVTICYIFAQYCPTTALCYTMHSGGTLAIAKFGTDSMKAELLPKIANGEIVIALAYRESGSHFGIDMTEKPESKNGVPGVILSGRKSFVTSSNYADFFLTYTNSHDVKGGRNNWLVSAKTPGLSVESSTWDGLGMRGNNSAPIVYNDVWVDSRYRIGSDGEGGTQTDFTMIYGILGFAGVYSGLGRAAFECILSHCKNRKYDDGSSIADVELVRLELADIYTKVASQHALTFNAVDAYERSDVNALRLAFAARLNATQNVLEICGLSMKLGGGIAYSKHLPLERYLRDSYASLAMSPTPDILKKWLGEDIVK